MLKDRKKIGQAVRWRISSWLPLLVLVSGFSVLHAQDAVYPPTMTIPVTFYDFHSDQSSPEFEITPSGTGQIRLGMVAPTLDAEKKPQLGPTPYFNRKIDRWFRPWVAGDMTIYNYYGESGTGTRFDRYEDYPAGLTALPYDTSFKNIVIQDSLVFRYIAGSSGLYEFASSSFFPLDGQGFGSERNNHNYSFTMELHWTFTMVPGLTFNFTGDDDVWAFVDNKQVMDIGGIHGPLTGSFNVDEIAGLERNKKYSFDFFYAERHVTGSNIRITTNIIAAPSVLLLYGKPGAPGPNNQPIAALDTIRPNDTLTVYGHIFDSLGVWQPAYDSLITWTVEPAGIVSLNAGKGSAVSITANTIIAGSKVILVATFANPDDPTQPKSQVRIALGVSPGEDRLDIVRDSLAGRAKETSFTSLTFESGVSTQKLFAVVRDRNGNFVRYATDATWQSTDPSVATVSPKNGASTVVTLQNTGIGDQAKIVVTVPGLKPDTLLILSNGVEARSVSPNPFTPASKKIETLLTSAAARKYENVIKSSSTSYVTLIALQTPEPLVLPPGGSSSGGEVGPVVPSYGKVVIYDATGNVIRSDLKLIKADNVLSYGVVWDGTNSRNRYVGSGVYLVVISAKRVSGKSYVLSQKVGVNPKQK